VHSWAETGFTLHTIEEDGATRQGLALPLSAVALAGPAVSAVPLADPAVSAVPLAGLAVSAMPPADPAVSAAPPADPAVSAAPPADPAVSDMPIEFELALPEGGAVKEAQGEPPTPIKPSRSQDAPAVLLPEEDPTTMTAKSIPLDHRLHSKPFLSDDFVLRPMLNNDRVLQPK